MESNRFLMTRRCRPRRRRRRSLCSQSLPAPSACQHVFSELFLKKIDVLLQKTPPQSGSPTYVAARGSGVLVVPSVLRPG